MLERSLGLVGPVEDDGRRIVAELQGALVLEGRDDLRPGSLVVEYLANRAEVVGLVGPSELHSRIA